MGHRHGRRRKGGTAVTADVDATGLQTLKEMIGNDEEILKLRERKKCKEAAN
jgi:hypothetical protein